MKKKIFALFLSILMVLSLVACTVHDPSTDTGSNTNSGTISSSGIGSLDTNSVENTDSVSDETDSNVSDATSDGTVDTSTNTTTNTTTNTVTGTTTDTVSSTSSKNPSTSTSSTNSASNSSTSTSGGTTEVPDVPVYDAKMDHKVILTDDTKNYSIVILDLDFLKQDWTRIDWLKSANNFQPVWEWKGSAAYCGVTYRELSSSQKFVLAVASGGRVDIVDYYKKKTVATLKNPSSVRATDKRSLYNAHAAEMLPNGDIVVACSGYAETGWNYENGGLRYYKRDGNTWTYKSYLSLPFAHAAVWDPSENCLWTVGFEGIIAVDLNTATGTMTKNDAKSLKIRNFTGHDMVPAFGMDGCFWVSDNGNVHLFDSAAKTLKISPFYSASQVKGIAYFEDGTMITSPAYQKSGQWYASSLYVYTTTEASNYKPKLQKAPTTAGIYKIHTCTPKYE
ncbi:MAG: hypothetical protein IIY12_01345 [Clostridia bacterium]|nr:hypothetical protein [Clostridia bacterium]